VKIHYSAKALRQLDEILTYIEERNPQGARHVSRRIQIVIDLLARHPLAGQETDRPGQRRMIASPYPYVIYYRIGDGDITIQRLRHTSRRPL